MKTRAVVMHELGGPEVLRVEEVDAPPPGTGEIRIRVQAFALNRSEAMFRHGWHPVKPALPSRIGVEAAGRVESIGDGVEGFAVGDWVGTLPTMDMNKCGAYAELVTAPAAWVVHNPPELGPLEAASLWSSYMTAYGALIELVTIDPGDHVVITAASSSVGPAAIQIANMLGARVIAITRKREKADAIRAMGAHEVIVTDEENLVDRIGEITSGKGAKVIFDPVGGPGVQQLAEATAAHGTIILYGVLSFDPAPLPLATLIQNNLTIEGYAMYLWDQPDRNARAIQFIREGVAQGKLRPVIAKQFGLDQIVDAARYLDSMQQVGKIVVSVGDAP